jgi:hypothetical protein
MLLCLLIGAADGKSLRQLEGHIQCVLELQGIDPKLAPDHSSYCRFAKAADYQQLTRAVGRLKGAWRARAPKDDETLTVAIDATGLSLTRSGGWAADKPGSTDRRRGIYDKLHAVADVETHEILAHARTSSHGAGSADRSAGPPLLDALAAGGWQVGVVCGDGAYDTKNMYDATSRLAATLIAPISERAIYGVHPDRDRLLTQQSRRGRRWWKTRSGYHQRSQVECCFAVFDRIGIGNRLRSKLDETKDVECLLKVAAYNRTRRAA